MKRITMIFAAFAAAFSLASCDKALDEENQPAEGVKFNITVTDPDGLETKAVKTGWKNGDKINIWVGTGVLTTGPDAVLTYDSTTGKWTGETLDSFESNVSSNGIIRALYEGYNDLSKYAYETPYIVSPERTVERGGAMPLSVMTESDLEYTFDGTTLTATLKWKYMNNVQIVVSGLDASQASSYSLIGWDLTTRAAFISTSGSSPYIKGGIETTDGPTRGVANADGVAFYFTTAFSTPKCGKDASWSFTLNDYTSGSKKAYTYTSTGNLSATSLNAIKIPFSAFSELN